MALHNMPTINLAFAKKVLGIVDKGLCEGIGNRRPGDMCVEAAVAYASGDEENHDSPLCVDAELSGYKIALNDASGWNGPKDRARGLRRLAIGQLGSNNVFHAPAFWASVRQTMWNRAKEEVIQRFNWTIKKAEQSIDLDLSQIRWVFQPTSELAEASCTSDVLSWYDELYPEREQRIRNHDVAEMFVQALLQQPIKGTKFLYLVPRPSIDKLLSRVFLAKETRLRNERYEYRYEYHNSL